MQDPDLAIIFVRTKRRVDELAEGLKKRGYSAEGLHGDLSQAKRDSVVRQFREGITDILVATDVAARGLDISGVTHVYNYDLPQDPESYVHRVGRTGRAGQSGLATTFVIPREIEHLRAIERLIKRKISRKLAPSLSEVLEGAQQAAITMLQEYAEKGDDVQMYRASAERLLSDYDSVALVSAAIKLLTKAPDTTPVKITEESPLRVRHGRKSESSGSRDGKKFGKGRDSRGRSSSDRPRRDGDRPQRDPKGNKDLKKRFKDKDVDKKKDKPKSPAIHGAFKPYFKD